MEIYIVESENLYSMNIVVLDAYTLNPGDLSWSKLEALGNLKVYDRTLPEEIVDRAKDAEIVLVNKVVIDGACMEALPNLKYIGVLATGLYPIELSLGTIAPFGSIGAAYTFGNLNTIYQDNTENKQNLSGGAVLAQAGLQYSYHILSVRVFGEYLYDFTPLNNPYISSLSGFSIGAELGIKF